MDWPFSHPTQHSTLAEMPVHPLQQGNPMPRGLKEKGIGHPL
jgi:hypothetical protein